MAPVLLRSPASAQLGLTSQIGEWMTRTRCAPAWPLLISSHHVTTGRWPQGLTNGVALRRDLCRRSLSLLQMEFFRLQKLTQDKYGRFHCMITPIMSSCKTTLQQKKVVPSLERFCCLAQMQLSSREPDQPNLVSVEVSDCLLDLLAE
jgi:hypothetical protein